MGLQVVLRVNIEWAALSFDSKLPKFKQLLWVKHGWRSEVTANVLFENIVYLSVCRWHIALTPCVAQFPSNLRWSERDGFIRASVRINSTGPAHKIGSLLSEKLL